MFIIKPKRETVIEASHLDFCFARRFSCETPKVNVCDVRKSIIGLESTNNKGFGWLVQ